MSRFDCRWPDKLLRHLLMVWVLVVAVHLPVVSPAADKYEATSITRPMVPRTASHQTAFGDQTPLLLNEISPWPGNGHIWIELINISNEPVSLAGWSIEFQSGDMLEFPSQAPACPGKGLVLLDLAAPADKAASNGKLLSIALRKSPALGQAGDALILHAPGGPVDAISWGQARAIGAGAPLWPPYGVIPEGPVFQPGDVLLRLPGAWPPTASKTVGSRHWAYRDATTATPGEANLLPGPVTMTPADDTRFASSVSLAVLGLSWADSVTFQIASDSEFTQLVIEETVSGNSLSGIKFEPGTYFWRVRGNRANSGTWSPAQSLTVLPTRIQKLLDALSGSGANESPSRPARYTFGGRLQADHGLFDAVIGRLAYAAAGDDYGYELPVMPGDTVRASRVLGLRHEVQRKDTRMVCMDGCPLHGDEAWNAPHPTTLNHGDHNCTRAALAMIASLGGCRLSQDRISYHIFEEAEPPRGEGDGRVELGSPYGDLGHQVGTPSRSSTIPALEWLYGQPPGSASVIVAGPAAFDDGNPGEINSIREFVDAGRPLIRISSTHSTVVDGYAIIRLNTGEELVFIRVLDPGNEAPFSWIEFEAAAIGAYLAPPRTGRPIRCDEPQITRDTDNDGLVDFDEIHRLHTDPANADTDGDQLSDMADMYGYLFYSDGGYLGHDSDWDGDGVAKELDPDNDQPENKGVKDGCEDINRNGFLDADGSESNNFDASDDFSVISPDCFRGYLRLESSVEGPLPESTFSVREEFLVDSLSLMNPDSFSHSHTWSIQGETLMALPNIPGMTGGAVRSVSAGEGATRGSIQIEIDDTGHYKLVTDIDPRVASYTIATTGAGLSRNTEEEYYLGFGDHHYDYVSPETPGSVRDWQAQQPVVNIFEGNAQKLPGGNLHLYGSDTVTLPSHLGGLNLQGQTTRTWEIWLDTSLDD